MTISAEKEAMILRLYHVEKWRCGTIAKQLHCHHTTVFRVLKDAGLPRHRPVIRPAEIDLYLPFIQQTLTKYPDLTSSRLTSRLPCCRVLVARTLQILGVNCLRSAKQSLGDDVKFEYLHVADGNANF
ncbi:helix-turn-helix domain-containing protein [Rhizobium sp. SL86]|uniref:helix-turn-helix domain-containing protein n=1 Tax=Rhizobium sp. SL86 TaxID=2995148 RepID=UPI002274449C|nr:helix-turn-helix domain-containing protein [Rhizobium sp. SL86]MCY1667634.1 helix-turn-helix domain-containing protein [Rhizobium sp. SL86]